MSFLTFVHRGGLIITSETGDTSYFPSNSPFTKLTTVSVADINPVLRLFLCTVTAGNHNRHTAAATWPKKKSLINESSYLGFTYLPAVIASAGIVFSLWVYVCVILAKSGSDDTYCTGNYHRMCFSVFFKVFICLCVYLWTDFVSTIASQPYKIESQNFTGIQFSVDQSEGRVQR